MPHRPALRYPAFLILAAIYMVALLEHLLLFYWGIIWTFRNLALYPADGAINSYILAASSLLIGSSVISVAALRKSVNSTALGVAASLSLPMAGSFLLSLLRLLYLDPVIDYLALLPTLLLGILPYFCVWALTKHSTK